MKRIMFLLLVILISNVSGTKLIPIEQLEREFLELRPYQRENLVQIFMRARKDNLSWTAVATSWEESKFGRFQMGFPRDGSIDCGVFHNNTTVLLDARDLKRSLYNKIGICTTIISNPELAYQEFKKNIDYWKRTRGKGNWFGIWKGYNSGYRKTNNNYPIMIMRRIRVIKTFMPYLKGNPFFGNVKFIIKKDPESI